MCSDYRLLVSLSEAEKVLAEAGVPVSFPDGRPNIEPRDDIRITDRSPIVRAAASGGYEMVTRSWSWPGPGGKPVYNFRSEGREFSRGRCLILADGFYEFTTPADPKAKRKHKWLFTLLGRELFGIAGLWRTHAGVDEAFTMLTTEPGPDIAPYHNRQIIILPSSDFVRWLDPRMTAREVLRPLPAGSLKIEQIG